jgi:hypothetical protein
MAAKDPGRETALEAFEILKSVDEEAAAAWAQRELAKARTFVGNEGRAMVWIVRECPHRQEPTPGVPDLRRI